MKIMCMGCGAEIQTKDEHRPGYLNEAVLAKRKEDFYCKRCFDLRHYNRNIEYEFDSQTYLDNLEAIKKDRSLIVNIVDLFDLEGTVIKNINKLLNTSKIIFVLNKVDLFLNSINLNRIEDYIRRYLKENGIKVLDVVLMSSFKSSDIEKLLEVISKYKENNNVYFMGMTNVGKSSILNKIIQRFTQEKDILTVSNTMNTTLGNVFIPYDKDTYFVDTPGIINHEHLMYYLDKDSMEKLTPRRYVRPKTYQLNPDQTLYIQGILRIDFFEGERSSFVTNVANDVLVHRTKLENADAFYELHKDDILKIPNESERNRLGKEKTMRVTFTEDQKIDIVVGGLGFISVFGKGKLVLKTFDNIAITIRKAIL